jgi:hypothetical protein
MLIYLVSGLLVRRNMAESSGTVAAARYDRGVVTLLLD